MMPRDFDFFITKISSDVYRKSPDRRLQKKKKKFFTFLNLKCISKGKEAGFPSGLTVCEGIFIRVPLWEFIVGRERFSTIHLCRVLSLKRSWPARSTLAGGTIAAG